MSALIINAYWICFGLGLGYLVVSAALGTLGMAGHGHDAALGHGHDFDSAGGLGSHDLDAAHPEFDSSPADFHSEAVHHESAAANMGHATDAGSADFASYKLYSPASIAAMLTGFGGGGLISAGSGFPPAVSLAAGLGGALLMGLLAWLVVGKWLMSLQSTSYAKQGEMLGIEAEVLTPIEEGSTGEIAYIMDGTRFTAPARLKGEGRAAKREKVRISGIRDNIVYVVQQSRLPE